jgi:TetR/AcrR family transcriptional regulator
VKTIPTLQAKHILRRTLDAFPEDRRRMLKEQSLTLADVEREADRFMMPATERERDIIRAAMDLLGERGVDGATTAEIAKRAGVTERTLFRYFPSKRDLVRRVLAPTILRTILTREWRPFGALLDGSGEGEKRPMFVSERFAGISTNPPVARALFGEITRNAELRNDLARLWRRHFWNPMLTTVTQLKAKGALRKDVDLEALVWAIDCLNIGYLFLRSIHAADRKWDDAKELEKMADILLRGSAAARSRTAAGTRHSKDGSGAERTLRSQNSAKLPNPRPRVPL